MTAAIAAVSVLSIFLANKNEKFSFFSIINCLSFSEKSPSGPMSIQTGPWFFFDKIFFKLFFLQLISQKIKDPFFGNLFKKNFKVSKFFISGIEIRFDCSLASIIIFLVFQY